MTHNILTVHHNCLETTLRCNFTFKITLNKLHTELMQAHYFIVVLRGPNSHIILRRRDFTVNTNRRFTTYPQAVKFLREYVRKNKDKWDKIHNLPDDKFLKV